MPEETPVPNQTPFPPNPIAASTTPTTIPQPTPIEKNPKWNKLSLLSVIILLISFGVFVFVDSFDRRLQNLILFLSVIAQLIAIILAYISLGQIKKTGEKGKFISRLIVIVFGAIFLILFLYSFLTSFGD